MANGIGGISIDVHGVRRIEVRQDRSGPKNNWVVIEFFGDDDSLVGGASVTAFCGEQWAELTLARGYVPQTGREADCLHNASERYHPRETTEEENNDAI